MLGSTGCGRAEAPAPGAEAATPTPAVAPTHIPAPPVPDNAPVAVDTYRLLDGSILSLARLVTLDPGIVLQAEGVQISESDLAASLSQVSPAIRDQLARHQILILEQQATDALLRAEAGAEAIAADPLALHKFVDTIVADVQVTEEDIETFYTENREMIGGAPLAQVSERIRQHLLAQKSEARFKEYLASIGDRHLIGISADWLAKHAAMAADNPIDKARASGIPTMVSFGADTCMPCQMMKPVREAVAEKYGARLNVVYVHVNKDQLLAQRYGVQGIPFMIFFDSDGNQIHSHTGMMSEEQIEEWLSKSGVAM